MKTKPFLVLAALAAAVAVVACAETSASKRPVSAGPEPLMLDGGHGPRLSLVFQTVTDAPQTFTNDKTFGGTTGVGGSITINQSSSTQNPALLVNGDAGLMGNVYMGSNTAVIFIDGGVTIGGSLTLPATAAGGAVSYFAGGPPEAVWNMQAVTFSNATKLGGYGLPGLGSVGTARAMTISAATGIMTTASAGTGSITVTVTDGTNTCTFTGTCAGAPPTTGFAGTTTFRVAATNGAGTGCVYPAGAALSASVTASNCGTTTPIGSISFEGNWQ